MGNRFFNIAVEQAARLGGKKGRILLLIAKLGPKINKVNWAGVRSQPIKEKFFVLGRIAKAYASGRYRGIPWKSMLIILGSIIYFINPLDMIPDLIPIAGLTDDFAILFWVYNSIELEIDKFLAWEESQVLKL
ncbi:MAG: YkvA family protein [Cyclobacteriaceae bacterium]|jgi:uncharacterized membrane protein YkvA (DUF1232 family)|nr:YkvA family protein [Cyclobacteriaceae bacterium]